MNYKIILGILASLIGFIGYIPYIRDIILNKTKPHIFSWIVWLILTAISFFIQVSDKAGPGAWVTGFSSMICLIIIILGFTKGTKNIVLVDWVSLILAIIAIIFWLVIKEPVLSLILVVLADVLGFVPTFRKSYWKPFEETMVTYQLNIVKLIIAVIALENFSFLTSFYQLYLIAMSSLLVIMLFIRRKHLGATVNLT